MVDLGVKGPYLYEAAAPGLPVVAEVAGERGVEHVVQVEGARGPGGRGRVAAVVRRGDRLHRQTLSTVLQTPAINRRKLKQLNNKKTFQ